jgi:hypothetical protein
MDVREIWWGVWADLSGSGKEPVPRSCEYGNEPSVSLKCCELHVWFAKEGRMSMELVIYGTPYKSWSAIVARGGARLT